MSVCSQVKTCLDLKSLSERLRLQETDLAEGHSRVIVFDEIEIANNRSPSLTPSTPATEVDYVATEGEYSSDIAFTKDTHHEERPLQTLQNALIVAPDRTLQLVSDFPVPKTLGSCEVMIRNCATGLNHIDWKSVEYNMCLPELPWVLGREMAGVVERVGSEVTRLRAGDRVWTSQSSSIFATLWQILLTGLLRHLLQGQKSGMLPGSRRRSGAHGPTHTFKLRFLRGGLSRCRGAHSMHVHVAVAPHPHATPSRFQPDSD